MKHMIKKITAVLLLTALLCPICPADVFGASGASVSISGDRNVKAGEVLTVIVTYKGSSLGYVNGHLTYDTDQLEYLSGGSSQGNAGLVQVKAYADDASGKLAFPVKFRAVGSGSTVLNLETLESQNLDGDQDMGTPSSNMTVKVEKGAGAATTASSEEEASDKEETQESTQSEEPSEYEENAANEEGVSAKAEEKGSVLIILFTAGAVVLVVVIAAIAVVLVRKKKMH